MASLKIGITFNEVDSDVNDYLKRKDVNASQLVRKLVERYMITKDINSSVKDVLNESNNEVCIDTMEEANPKNKTEDPKQQQNLNKLKSLSDIYK